MLFNSLQKKLARFEKKFPILHTLLLLLAVVLFWRGAWGLMDRYFFPDNELLSYLLSAIFGLFILLITDYEA
ncbi:hypothetical protein IT418_01970 [bacterium]|nr:hypothetical protein [bacterium]